MRSWVKKLYKPRTASAKERLNLCSNGVVIRKKKANGEISVLAAQWFLYCISFATLDSAYATTKVWRPETQRDTSLSEGIWATSCKTPLQTNGGGLRPARSTLNLNPAAQTKYKAKHAGMAAVDVKALALDKALPTESKG